MTAPNLERGLVVSHGDKLRPRIGEVVVAVPAKSSPMRPLGEVQNQMIPILRTKTPFRRTGRHRQTSQFHPSIVRFPAPREEKAAPKT